MRRMAKASLHVKRNLSPRERVTIAVALELLLQTPAPMLSSTTYAMYVDGDGIEPDEAIASLIHEFTTARKVKLCRSKQTPA